MVSMFQGATSFNGNLSLWNVSSVTVMQNMFYGATSFNQNLCARSENFQAKTLNMFRNSGCTFQEDPTREEGGPFCESSYSPTGSHQFLCREFFH